MEQKPTIITLRQLGAKIGSRVRFVEDPPDVWRTVENEEQLDYGHMLPWIVEAAQPERTYTRKQVARICRELRNAGYLVPLTVLEKAIRAIDIDAAVKGG